MKKIFLVLSLIIGATTFAQSNLKFAHFNYEKVSDSLPTVMAAQKELENLQGELKSILDELETEFNDSQILFERQVDSLSPMLREIKEKALQEQYQTILLKQEEYSQKYQTRVTELMQPIEDNLKKAIKIVAEKNKLNYVFEESTLMYVNGGIDLTSQVKAELINLEKVRMAGN